MYVLKTLVYSNVTLNNYIYEIINATLPNMRLRCSILFLFTVILLQIVFDTVSVQPGSPTQKKNLRLPRSLEQEVKNDTKVEKSGRVRLRVPKRTDSYLDPWIEDG